MITGSVARRYAQALFELSKERGTLEADYESLKVLSVGLQADAEARAWLSNPTVPRSARRDAMAALGKRINASETLSNFLQLLADRDRADHLPGIFAAFENYRNQAAGRVRVEVRSAAPLSDDEAKRLAAALRVRLGKSVELALEVDATLLGGLWVRVGSQLMDNTVKTQLQRFQDTLVNA